LADDFDRQSGDTGGQLSLSYSPGGDMKKTLINTAILFTVVSCATLSMQAAMRPGYQSATVVSVEAHETTANSNYAGSNPSDAPLASPEVYSYQIAVRLGCTLYRIGYDSMFDYPPSVFVPNHTIEVKPQKRVMYVNLPGDREVRLGISGRKNLKDGSCVSGG
jgi:hypothetical protein